MLNKVLLALLLILIIIVYIQRIDGIEFGSIRRKKGKVGVTKNILIGICVLWYRLDLLWNLSLET